MLDSRLRGYTCSMIMRCHIEGLEREIRNDLCAIIFIEETTISSDIVKEDISEDVYHNSILLLAGLSG